jgi:hypothetical protein
MPGLLASGGGVDDGRCRRAVSADRCPVCRAERGKSLSLRLTAKVTHLVRATDWAAVVLRGIRSVVVHYV